MYPGNRLCAVEGCPFPQSASFLYILVGKGFGMSEPQHLGLGELGQRVQALSDPVSDPRLRPYQGAPLPVGPAANGRPASPPEELRSVDFRPEDQRAADFRTASL